MNNKGQGVNLGLLITVAITIIVGLVLLVPVAQEAGFNTDKITYTNVSTPIGANGSYYNWTDMTVIDSIEVYNYTNASGIMTTIEPVLIIAAGNYTTYNEVVVGDVEVSQYRVENALFASTAYGLNITRIGEAPTYIGGGAGSITKLIIVFFAIGIMVIALIPTTRSKILEAFGR